MNESIFFISFYVLSFALFSIVIYIIIMEYRAQNIALFFWITVLLVYVLPSITDPFREEVELRGISLFSSDMNDVLLNASIFATGFCCTYLFTRKALFCLREPKIVLWEILKNSPTQLKYNREIYLFVSMLAIVAVTGFIVSVYALYINLEWSGVIKSGYTSYRLKADSSYMLLGAHLTHISAAGLFLAWITKRWGVFCIIILSVIGWYMLRFNRSIFITLAIPFFAYAVYRVEDFRGFIKIILVILFAYLFIIFLEVFRYFGSAAEAIKALQSGKLLESLLNLLRHSGGEADLRFLYYFLIGHDRSAFDVFWGQGYARLLFLPIPSKFMLGFKPGCIDAIIYYFWHTGTDVVGGTSHTLIFGDSYVNFGWFGIFCGSIWAIIATIWNRIMVWIPFALRIHMIGIFGSAAVMLARGTIYNSCSRAFWQLLLALIVYYVGILIYSMIKFASKPAS